MSTKGIYTALSGALAQSQQLDTLANNIANVNTPGFKGDRNTFKEYLTVLEKAPDVNTVPRTVASLDSFYDMQGTDKSYVDVSGTFTDHTQGGFKATGNSLDVALEGRGFIEVLTPSGPRLTRKGTMTLSPDGILVTTDGHPVLSRDDSGAPPGSPGATPPQDRIINVNDSGAITFTQQGEIFQNGENLGQLSIVEFDSMDHLKKVGNALYASTDPTIPLSGRPNTGVLQGFLETSNVNIVEEMTKMIQTSRNFESAQRVIKAYDEIDGKLVNEVPKLG
ncbi:MAG: flagellar basal-body rod protein FlgF [Oligoflexia bacterium]|nr:flagellar basal-body rod protein FlgF [Oligoflexia bacterium]